MSEELQLSRRGLLHMVSAIVVTASFAARRPLVATANSDESLDTKVTDEPAILDLARGSKLEIFLRNRGIRPAHLARESGYSRRHLLGVRLGRIAPTRRCIADIAAACRRLSREPIRASHLFDLTRTDAWVIERLTDRRE